MALTQIKTYSFMECGGCGVSYALSDDFIEARQNDHKTWYCPNGCSRYYPAKSEKEKLQAEVNRLRATNSHLYDQNDSLRRSRNATKGHLTRTKKRIANGVCPCCNRTFADLAKHMSTKHPKYNPESEASDE